MDLTETFKAGEMRLGGFGPDDFFTLKQSLEELAENLSAEQILAYLRLSCHDHKSLANCLPALISKAPQFPPRFERQVLAVCHEVWKNYYPIGERYDLACGIGELLSHLRLWIEAIEFLERSIHLYGPTAQALTRMAACDFELGHITAASDLLRQGTHLAPDDTDAKALLARIEQHAAGNR